MKFRYLILFAIISISAFSQQPGLMIPISNISRVTQYLETPDHRYGLTGNLAGDVIIWELSSASKITTLHSSQFAVRLKGMTLSSDQKNIIILWESEVDIFDVKTFEKKRFFITNKGDKALEFTAICCTSDPDQVFIGGD